MKSYDIATGRIKSLSSAPVYNTLNEQFAEKQKISWNIHPGTIEYKEQLKSSFENLIASAMNNAEAGDNNRAVINLIKAKTIKERLMLI